MKTAPGAKLIVCILPQGRGLGLVERLSAEKDVTTANVSSGRGRGAGPVGAIGAWDEVDILTVPVPPDRADEIFAFLYDAGDLHRPRGGIMYQQALAEVTPFVFPEVEAAGPA